MSPHPAPFHPAQFLGRPLPEVLAALGNVDPETVFQGQVELHAAQVSLTEPVTCRPGTLMPTVADADLPDDHPEVEIPGVTLEQFLGGGGQGWVYAGRVRATGHIVAVKVLRADYVAAQGWAAREAILCARVRHRNILRVFQTQPAGAFWVIIMELIRGQDLETLSLTPGMVRSCLGQIADALRELRNKNIVHCDIKPSNILLRRQNHSPVLVDFGIAVDSTTPSDRGPLIGTPYYMAPEALQGSQPHSAWDAYSLGVTAASILGIHQPFDTLGALRAAKISGTFDRQLVQAMAGVNDVPLRGWVEALLHRDPQVRLGALDSCRNWLAA